MPGLVAHVALGAFLEVLPGLVLARADLRRPGTSAAFPLALATAVAATALAASGAAFAESLRRTASTACTELATALGGASYFSRSEATSQRHFLEALVGGGVGFVGLSGIAELLSFQDQIRNLLDAGFDMLGSTRRREVARLVQVSASHVGGVALAPAAATGAGEVLHRGERRLDDSILCRVQRTEGAQSLVVVVLQIAIGHHFAHLGLAQTQLGEKGGAPLRVFLALIRNSQARLDNAVPQALESEESVSDTLVGAATPRGVIVEDARLNLQLVGFIVWPEKIHKNLHTIVDFEGAPILAGQVRTGLGTMEGVEESQSHFIRRNEGLCTAHPDLDASLEGLERLSVRMASVGGDNWRLSTPSVETVFVFFLLFFV